MKRLLRWVSGISVVATAPYFTYRLAHDPTVNPALGTWILFAVACVLCYRSYLQTDQNKNWEKSMLNLADCITTILASLSIAILRPGSLQFRWPDALFATTTASIYLYWRLSRQSFDANLMFNGLIASAYGPTVWKIVVEGKNESFSWWIPPLISGVLALYPAAAKESREESRDDYRQRVLATIYPVRSITCIVILMYLMAWYS